ncbi:hypothetical protein EYF80_019843 [Liparis tanakae]|uniref:Uncharacterized protein n=1 Tax=Liparis tanakae TaxID=230148 RepID=A0A4Z2HWK3_9TELE|nr:hypothetical protein EYF80_019843 [Liparis tanakae]
MFTHPEPHNQLPHCRGPPLMNRGRHVATLTPISELGANRSASIASPSPREAQLVHTARGNTWI